MTCWRGYIDGDHDGWVADGKNSPNTKFHHDGWTDKPQVNLNSWPNETTEKDYSYKPFKEKLNGTEKS